MRKVLHPPFNLDKILTRFNCVPPSTLQSQHDDRFKLYFVKLNNSSQLNRKIALFLLIYFWTKK